MELSIIDNKVLITLDAKDTTGAQALAWALRAEIAASNAERTARDMKTVMNVVTSDNWNLNVEYSGYVILFTANFPVTCTVPPGLSVTEGFSVRHYRFEGRQLGTGQVTIVPGPGATLKAFGGPGTIKTAGPNATFYVEGLGSGEYLVRGDITVS